MAFRASRPSRAWRTSPTRARSIGSAWATSTSSAAATISRRPRSCSTSTDTDDLTHGQQQLALFNTPAGGYCFQPIHIFEGNSGKPILSLLRPGKRPSGEEIARVLWHVIHRIRRHWPDVRILVRGDGHYCAPEVLNLLRRLRCDYILGLPINVKLDAIAKPWREQCEQRREAGRFKKVRRMHQFTYQAGSWARKVILPRRDPNAGATLREARGLLRPAHLVGGNGGGHDHLALGVR